MQERICIYRYIELEDSFECVGRHSAHHSYRQSSLRKRYSSNMGIIADVWHDGQLNGFKRDKNIPSPSLSKAAYYKYLKDMYRIPRDISKHFRMNPVDIIAEVIVDTKNIPIAVIVFESQRKDFLNETAIKTIYNPTKKAVIREALDRVQRPSSPTLGRAKGAKL